MVAAVPVMAQPQVPLAMAVVAQPQQIGYPGNVQAYPNNPQAYGGVGATTTTTTTTSCVRV